MTLRLEGEDRYLIHRQGQPVCTAPDLEGVIVYLWGRDTRHQYVVFDYERPYPVDTPDLTTWAQRLPA